MPQFLGPAQYRDIRAAIAPDLADDKGALPDDVIGSDIYAGSSIRELAALDPLFSTRTGEEFQRCQAAAVLLCAARLAPRIPDIIAETIGPYQMRMQPRDFGKLADDLRYEAFRLLALNQPAVDPVAQYRPTAFALGRGGRGDVRPRTWYPLPGTRTETWP